MTPLPLHFLFRLWKWVHSSLRLNVYIDQSKVKIVRKQQSTKIRLRYFVNLLAIEW